MQGSGHSNILKIRDVVTIDGHLGIVMPKFPMSLGDAIETKGLDRPKKVTIAHGLLSALTFLHDNDIMHRDVKSDNVSPQQSPFCAYLFLLHPGHA